LGKEEPEEEVENAYFGSEVCGEESRKEGWTKVSKHGG
jgi:hypothetical protein